MKASPTSKRIALVTGAAGTIGPAICECLKADGWQVIAAGRTLESFQRYQNLNGRPHPSDARVAGDLTSAEACQRLVQEAEAALGPVRLLVNNATGNVNPPASLDEMTAAYCSQVFRVDAEAPIHLAKAALPSLRATKGQIVNVSSVRRHSFDVGSFVYSAAKGAVEALTEALAFELFDDGIRVNAIRVGAVPGDSFLRPALQNLDPETAARVRADISRQHREELQGSGMPCAAPEEIGKLITFLASDAARFVNGAILDADGGFSAQMQRKLHNPEAKPVRHTIHDHWEDKPEQALKEWLETNKE